MKSPKQFDFTVPAVSIVEENTDEEAASERRKRGIKFYADSGIPPKYRGAKIEDLGAVPHDATARYRDTLNRITSVMDHPSMLVLNGIRGTGKTWMACALVLEFCKLGRCAVYLEAMDYFIALQETFDNGSKVNSSSIERKHIEPELLVLDAMEERADTTWNDRMLVRLVNKRYAANKSTLMISNQDRGTFEKHVGPSIADRICDGGGFITCDWKSLRGRVNL